MKYLKTALAALLALPSNVRAMVTALFVGLAVSAASAQTTTGSGLDMTGPIATFGTTMRETITTNAPALFIILALAVGFYFLWGRVRSLF